jgi:pyridoxine/pyridoxamine 5'-phosphate oxidase
VTEKDLLSFLQQSRLGILSTIGPSGEPQSALVGIAVTPELEIVFDTVKTSRKYPNLVARPACAFVFGWTGVPGSPAGPEQTLQYEGAAEELQGSELERCQEVYFRVWPDGPARLAWPGIVYFVVKPRWIRYSDFDLNPPLIEEFTFGR